MQNPEISNSSIYWFFDLTNFSNDSVSILPTLLISHNLPYKLIYSEKTMLKIENYPPLTLITKVFKSNPYKLSSSQFASGYSESNQVQTLSEHQFFLETQYSSFTMIQAYRDPQYEKIFHKLEYRSTHYNSFVLIKRNKEIIVNDEISIEKNLNELTIKYAEALESMGKSMQVLILQFFVDSELNLVFEKPTEWYFSDLIDKKIVKTLPVIFASFQYYGKLENAKNYSIGVKPRPIQAKPRVLFREGKYKKMVNTLSAESFSHKLNNSLKLCNGGYCDLQIKNCYKSIKIPIYLYNSLPHRIIRATALSLSYPIAESQFTHLFSKLYIFNLKSSKSSIEIPIPISFKQTNFTLCPICSKIITLAKSFHLTPQ